jgi:hypothetical protein
LIRNGREKSMVTTADIQKDLPNWPAGVIDPWLVEFANDPGMGWPPPGPFGDHRWWRLLGQRPVSWWRNVRADRYNDASLWAEKVLRNQPNSSDALRALAIASALAGDLEKAQRVLQIAPGAHLHRHAHVCVAGTSGSVCRRFTRAGMPE